MKRIRNGLKSVFEFLGDSRSWLISPLVSVIVIFVFIAAVLSCACYIELVTERVQSLLPFKALNVLHIWDSETITTDYIKENKQQFRDSIEMIVNVFVAVSSLLLCLYSAFSYFKRVVKFNKSSSFQKRKVFENGVEDVEVMLKHFKGADYIAIFSRTFAWINRNEEMKAILTEAAKKKELALYAKDTDIVSTNLKGQNELLSVLHENKTNELLHVSYVERNNAHYILYRQEVNHHAYIITVKENPESRYLIEIISKLIRAKA